MLQKILRSCFILLSSVCLTTAQANENRDASFTPKKKEIKMPVQKEKVPVFCGLSVSADLAGAAMKAFGSNFAQVEAALRVNLKEKFFPTVELGYGFSDYTSGETDKSSRTNAPYMRIGMDYNFTKKRNGNRLYVGIRYGFTSFKYDLTDNFYRDPVWNEPLPFHLNNEPGKAHWGEVVAGVETEIWKFIQMGWNIRYKLRFNEDVNKQGSPWYLPGFGKNGNTCFGGTFNIIFEI